MGRRSALYTRPEPTRVARARVELERDLLFITMPDGRWRNLTLNGCTFVAGDATRTHRFVRHLSIILAGERADLITPPDEGAIAPRGARLPEAPEGAAVVDPSEWDAVADWLSSGGRLGGRTVAELSHLACIATPQFAVIIGEIAAKVAAEMIWEKSGPMRGGADMRHSLRPLQEAARTHPRAADALVAALAATAMMRSSRRR
jgi:hypothetical protein